MNWLRINGTFDYVHDKVKALDPYISGMRISRLQ
jgi:hypothetical protein